MNTTYHVTTDELIATVRRVSKRLRDHDPDERLHLVLAAAELERLAYPERYPPSKPTPEAHAS